MLRERRGETYGTRFLVDAIGVRLARMSQKNVKIPVSLGVKDGKVIDSRFRVFFTYLQN